MHNALRQIQSVRGRLLSTGLVVAALLSLLFVSGWKAISIVKKESAALSLLKESSSRLQATMRGLAEYALTEGTPASLQLTQQAIAGFEDTYRTLARDFDSPAFKGSLSGDIGPAWEALQVGLKKYLSIKEISPNDTETMILYGKLSYRTDVLFQKVEELVDQVSDHTARLTRLAVIAFSGLTVATSGIVLFLLFRTCRDITGSLERITWFVNRTTEGDLTCELDLQREDEIGKVALGFSRMASRLRAVVGRVRGITTNVSQVATVAEASSARVKALVESGNQAVEESATSIEEMDQNMVDIAIRSQQLANTARGVASSVEEFNTSTETIAGHAGSLKLMASNAATSVEEMIGSVSSAARSVKSLNRSFEETVACTAEVNQSINSIDNKVGESARFAEEVACQARETGVPAITAVADGMDAIRQSVSTLAEGIERLNRRTEEIGQIINVIESVADQTQLLSLNAAILSAQAGEHGAPFGVVAIEIKKLATQSMNSIKDVSDLIDAVQKEARSSTDLVRHGIEAVKEGMDLVRGTQEAFESIQTQAAASAKMSKSVYDSTAEQTTAIEKSTHAMKEVSKRVEDIDNAMHRQRESGRQILGAVEKTKATSQHMLEATVLQSKSCNELTQTSNDALEKAAEIEVIVANQKQRSGQVVADIRAIKEATSELIPSVDELNQSVLSLRSDVEALEGELQDFAI